MGHSFYLPYGQVSLFVIIAHGGRGSKVLRIINPRCVQNSLFEHTIPMSVIRVIKSCITNVFLWKLHFEWPKSVILHLAPGK